MVNYEYKKVPYELIRDRHGDMSVEKLNAFGEDGWQLVMMLSGEVIFKRKKVE
jgi:hypothetical protein